MIEDEIQGLDTLKLQTFGDIDMNQTPCEKLGYKVGDKFIVIEGGHVLFRKGQELILKYDDEGETPIFRDIPLGRESHVALFRVKPLTSSEGMKFDDGKSRMDLCDPEFLLGIGDILTFGAKKYDENNWQGVSKKRYFAACLRHILALMRGEKLDEESGKHHALHAACCLMFIFWKDNNSSED